MEELDEDVYVLLKQLNDFSPNTYEHSIRVANLCVAFGTKIGLSDVDIETLKLGGLLHDIGKLEVPGNILHKPSKLTNDEYNLVKEHPNNGLVC